MALWGVDIKKEVGGRSLKKIQFVHLNFLMTFLVIYYKFSNLGKFINFPLVSEKKYFFPRIMVENVLQSHKRKKNCHNGRSQDGRIHHVEKIMRSFADVVHIRPRPTTPLIAP